MVNGQRVCYLFFKCLLINIMRNFRFMFFGAIFIKCDMDNFILFYFTMHTQLFL